jgi:hypothetical protein
MINSMKTTRGLTLYQTMLATINQMAAMNDTAIVMGQSFDTANEISEALRADNGHGRPWLLWPPRHTPTPMPISTIRRCRQRNRPLRRLPTR